MELSELAPERTQLSSGATALCTRMPGRKLASLSLLYRTGSRFESPADNGISHLLEHMLFRGSPSHPSSHQLALAFEDLGGTLHASTAADHGQLAITVPRDNLNAAIRLVAEVYQRPLLQDLDVERNIIFEEILEDYDDAGQLIDGASLLRQASFGSHGLGQPITGPQKNVASFEMDDVTRWLRKTNVGGSLVLAAAGDLDPRSTFDTIEKALSGLPCGQPLQGEAPQAHRTTRLEIVQHPGSSQTALHVGYRGAASTDPLEPALDLLLRVIDDGMSTRLYHRICDSLGLCYDASATYETYSDAGLVEFEAETTHEQAPRVLEEVLKLAEELRQDGATLAELERVRRRLRWQYDALVDEAPEIAELTAGAELDGTQLRPALRLEELLDVDLNDIKNAAARFLSPEERVIVAVGQPSGRERQELERLSGV